LESGEKIDLVLEKFKKFDKKLLTFIVPKNLNRLNKSGRISNLKKFIGNKFSIIPIIKFHESKNTVISARRTQLKCFKKIINNFEKIIESRNEKLANYTLVIQYTGENEIVKLIKNELNKLEVVFKNYEYSITSIPVMAHVGEGVFCATIVPDL